MYGDENTFAQTTAPLSWVFVSFHSPGGNLLAGIGIGKIIHARGYVTYVGAGSVCGSACATAWLGGVRKAASAPATIAFHAASEGGRESAPDNALVGQYLAEIGITSPQALSYLLHAGPDDAQELNFADARNQLGITVEQQEWQQTAAAIPSSTMPAPVAAPIYNPAPAYEPPAPAYQHPTYSA